MKYFHYLWHRLALRAAHRGEGGAATLHKTPLWGGLMKAIIDYMSTLTLTRAAITTASRSRCCSWEKKFVNGAFRTPGDSALTVARGDGKSALVAAAGMRGRRS